MEALKALCCKDLRADAFCSDDILMTKRVNATFYKVFGFKSILYLFMHTIIILIAGGFFRMYRLRSIDRLLKEISEQTIYFAPSSAFNDPLEGRLDIVYHGDSVVWKNLFRHFLLCMEQKVTLATLHRPEEFESFFKYDFPIFIAEAELPTDLYRQHFKVIKERFFSYDKITAWINYLGSRRTFVHNEQLYIILSFISNIALESILYGHDQAGFQPQTEFWIALQKTVNNDPLKAMFDVINEAEEEQVDIIMELSSRMLQQMNLLMYCNLGENAKLINWGYFSSGFLSEYVDNLQRLIYPRWYAASFMECFPKSTSLWGHYADSHKGACLMYNFEKSTTNNELYIELERPKGITSSGTDKGYTPTYLKKVYYSNSEIQVDFFKRLWTQPHYIVVSEWYTSDDGQKSPLISETNPDEETRLAYWDNLIKIQTTKTENWMDENEYRLLINDSFHNFSEPQSRVLKYKFNALSGIVFGIRTPIEEKARIIEVIFSKCKKNGQQDFPFYQARYDKEQNIVVYDELSLLKFE